MKRRISEETAARAQKGICLFLLVLSVLAMLKTIWISLDIDESYALAVGYRLATGEKLFLDLWESHQLGGIVLAPFVALFLKIAGTTTYLVIYARVIGTLIHVAIGVFLYRTAVQKGELSRTFSQLLFFLHINFLPKWVQCPEFELQQYWFALLAFLFLYRYYRGGRKKKRYLLLAGVMLVGQMLSYPTLILVYPVYVLGIFLCGNTGAGKGEKVWKSAAAEVLCFTAGAAGAGILLLAYLRSYMTPETFMQNVSYIFQDESHTLVSTEVKWKIFGAQFLEILLCTAAVTAVSVTAGFVFSRRKKNDLCTRRERWQEGVFPAVAILFLLTGFLQAAGGLVGNENQFYMLWRFFAISLLGAAAAFAVRTEENKRCLWFGILPGFVTLFSVLLITNMNVNVSMAKMYTGVIAAAWMAGKRYESGRMRAGLERIMLRAGILVFLAGLFVCKLVQMRVTGCGEVTVLAPMKRIEEGPAKGIYMLEDTATVLADDYEVLTEQLSAEDKLLYIGNENIVYLWTEAQVATPSTQGTNAYNEMYLRYYEMHPEKIPTVIAVDKELEENPVYYNSPQNYIIYDWMDRMEYVEILDAAYIKLYRIKEQR